MQLRGKVVVITGASSGIGKACAIEFARAAAIPVLVARRRSALTALAAVLRSQFRVTPYVVAVDLCDPDALNEAFRAQRIAFSRVAILVNNAGIGLGRRMFAESQPDQWDAVLQTNVLGLMRVTRLIAPSMLARSRGHIINIGSIAGREPYARGSVYCASKAAVASFTASLRQELHPHGIRVTTVDPGLVRTPFGRRLMNGDRQAARALYARMRPLTAKDIADVVVFCATRPRHVSVTDVLVLPTDQSTATAIHRRRFLSRPRSHATRPLAR
jgi:NADP-dependent 3-hydroxy acid dehydrogenase YdfG